MNSVLLTVKDTFSIPSVGLVFAPELNQSLFPSPIGERQIPVALEYPDGVSLEKDLTVSLVHFNPHGFRVICFSRALKKEDVPAGTKVWWNAKRCDRSSCKLSWGRKPNNSLAIDFIGLREIVS